MLLRSGKRWRQKGGWRYPIDIGSLILERGQPDKALQMFKGSLQIQVTQG